MTLLRFPAGAAVPTAAPSSVPVAPRAPQSVEETGLSQGFLVELVAKTMFQRGIGRLVELSQSLALSASVVESLCQFMRREVLVEITRRGATEADLQYDLTAGGRARAADWLARSQYVGPAPVPLEAYVRKVQSQSASAARVTQPQVREAFADLVVPMPLQDQIGIGVNAGRPLLMYGPPGTGKTYLAERVQRLLPGRIAVPHAICVHGEVIRVFDEHWHRPVAGPDAGQASIDSRYRADGRWVVCERPCVMTGGELTLEMLDLAFDARAGYYEAPPHFKANNGVFIVDDLGRQRVSPDELMNRWIVPMERGEDYLMLRSGGKFAIPFSMVLVFCSNLGPQDLEDAAFLRRMGQKIPFGALSEHDYRVVFERAAEARGWTADAAAFEALRALHRRDGDRPMYACYPRDLVTLAHSRATFLGTDGQRIDELLDWAWRAYFGTDSAAAPARIEGAKP